MSVNRNVVATLNTKNNLMVTFVHFIPVWNREIKLSVKIGQSLFIEEFCSVQSSYI